MSALAVWAVVCMPAAQAWATVSDAARIAPAGGPATDKVPEPAAVKPSAKPLTVTEVLQPTASVTVRPVLEPVPTTQPVAVAAKSPCGPSRLEKAVVIPLGAYGVPCPLEEEAKPDIVCGRGAAPCLEPPPTGGGAPVPEPATLVLMSLAGAAGVLARRVRRRAERHTGP